MIARRFSLTIVVALFMLLVAGPECYAALAGQVGGARPRYTARLSSNKAIRKQQLIVDPEGIIGGSASVTYNPAIVRLVDVLDPGDFEITSGLVGIIPEAGGLATDLVPLETFFGTASGGVAPMAEPEGFREQGFVQIFFDRRDVPSARGLPGNSVIPNLPNFVTVSEDGLTGINDTHALIFEYLPGIDPSLRSGYTVFATRPREYTVPDSIIPEDDPTNPIPFDQLGTAFVAGSLDYRDPVPAVPLPPAFAAGVAMLSLLATRRTLRRC